MVDPAPTRILVIEDEETLASLYERILQRRSMEAEVYSNAGPALEALAQRPGSYRGVLLDLNLPDISGQRLVDSVRAAAPGLPLVLVSGLPANFPCPSNAVFLQKPFQIAQLEAAFLVLGL